MDGKSDMEIALEFELSGLANPLAKISGVRATVLPKPDQIEGQITVDALLTTARSKDHLPKIVDHCQGLKWIHVLGTGVDSFPFALMNDMRLTCSRGATAIPISEWVLAMMLAHEKQLPDRWITKPPKACITAGQG